MIVKMKFLQISGPETDIDRMCSQYLSKHEMQLENAIAELKTTDNLQPFIEVNPYTDPLAKAEHFCELLSKELSREKVKPDRTKDTDAILEMIRDINRDYVMLQEKRELLKKDADELKEKAKALEPFRSMNIDLGQVAKYRFLNVRFGRIGLDYYQRLEKYLFGDLDAVFLEGSRNDSYVYGSYVTSNKEKSRADSVFNSLHFERIKLNEGFQGTPQQAYEEIQKKLEDAGKEIEEIDKKLGELMKSHAGELLGARDILREASNYFDVRKKAAKIENEEEKGGYYTLCGWMGEEDVEEFLRETKDDPKVMVMVEEDREKYFGESPTKLKNPRFFKPFEMFIRMYGLPAADEMDPTMFVAITYTFIFGAMFGDLGQGAVLFVGGGLLYLIKKINLAGIISIAGLFSMFFGVMFGSVFGFEDVIPALWIRPVEAMTDLPFIGQLNTVFVVAIAFGMGLNILVIIFQIINAARAHDKENLLFSHNGIAGLVFYAFIVLTVVLYMSGHKTPGNILMIIFLGIPILLFLFKEPLGNLVEKRHKKMETGKGMFLVQGFFELFETMLSYFSNTLSYVRIGAFAVSHAAIMEVVLMLAGAESGSPNWIGVIFGNAFVMALEGLIVGIQVLRLEYYEMFSRFYKGSGREFKPFNRIDSAH